MLKRSGVRTAPLGTPFLSRRSLLYSSTTVGKDNTAIIDKLHHHLENESIGQESKELAGKSPMPYGVVCCCEVDEHSTGFLFVFKAILNILTHASDLF